MSNLVSDGRTEVESNQALRLDFQKQLVERAAAAWPVVDGVYEKWTAVRGTLIESADELVGKVKVLQRDWFRKTMGTLKPLQRSRNSAYIKWLASREGDDLMRFKQAWTIARRTIRAAKKSWFQEKAEEIEKKRFGGKEV